MNNRKMKITISGSRFNAGEGNRPYFRVEQTNTDYEAMIYAVVKLISVIPEFHSGKTGTMVTRDLNTVLRGETLDDDDE